MEIVKTGIDGLLIFRPDIYKDKRGYFSEIFRQEWFDGINIQSGFVQENESYSQKNVLRGLHFQNPPYEQGKVIRVINGAIRDVAVDIRRNSPTYGEWKIFEMSENSMEYLWLPAGFAHGFVCLEDGTKVQYKCTNYYNREAEGSIRWNDPDLAIHWNVNSPIISDKDHNTPFFKELQSLF
ncbi:MAG: dTDP-4-dehydrorhamnose 3,5-epimerase [Bacteroidales bacterium]|nr:dTDP-4-dehydrorhamnose 3,5-epimerase [Bacteroidales bacterium]